MLNKLHRCLNLLRSPSDLFLLIKILGFAYVFVPCLMRLQLPKLKTALKVKRSPVEQTVLTPKARKTIYFMDRLLGKFKPRLSTYCLTRGVTLYYFLQRAGVDITLCFGVGKDNDLYLGHCWLEGCGEPIYESRDPRNLYTETYRF